jgi:hypothetical protein
LSVSTPLFFRPGDRARDYGFREVPPRPVGRFRNVVVSGLRASMTRAETLFQGGAVIASLSRAIERPYARRRMVAEGNPINADSTPGKLWVTLEPGNHL